MSSITPNQPPRIALSYDERRSEESAKALVFTLKPDWNTLAGDVEITVFTDGITNNLLKLTKNFPSRSEKENEEDSVLLRAYGNNTEILIDRDREATAHALLAERGLAPPLLARFKNGLLYRYIPGIVCKAIDLTQEVVWRGVARRLAQWHAILPIEAVSCYAANGLGELMRTPRTLPIKASTIAGRMPAPNIWSVMQKWIHALPYVTQKDKERRDMLQTELNRSFQELDNTSGLGQDGLIFGHCDLLSGNVIILQSAAESSKTKEVSFIDYEYATPCPAAFDIANHFAEWGGFDCDYNMLPTRSVRHLFLQEYLDAYSNHAHLQSGPEILEKLFQDIDRYRGMPGFYWGIWALIQAKISQIDFDYASYAQTRLGEYWAWRAEIDGSREGSGKTQPLREQRWRQE